MLLLVVAITTFLAACSKKDTPKEIVNKFFIEVLQGDSNKAADYVYSIKPESILKNKYKEQISYNDDEIFYYVNNLAYRTRNVVREFGGFENLKIEKIASNEDKEDKNKASVEIKIITKSIKDKEPETGAIIHLQKIDGQWKIIELDI